MIRTSFVLAVLFVVMGLLSGAPAAESDQPCIVYVYGGGGLVGRFKAIEESLHIQVQSLTDDNMSSKDFDASTCRLMVIPGLRGLDSPEDKSRFRDFFLAAKKKSPGLRIIGSSQACKFLAQNIPELTGAGAVETDAQFETYSGFNAISPENSRRLLVYLAVTYLGRPGKIEPPEKYENRRFYHPDREGTFATVEEFLGWTIKRGGNTNAARALIESNMGHITGMNQQVIDGLIRAFEKRGLIAAAMNTIDEDYEQHLREFRPDILMLLTGKSGKLEFYLSIGAPRLQPTFLMGESIDQWRQPDTAATKRPMGGGMGMMMVTRESQGAIEPRVVAGPQVASRDFSKPNLPIPDRMERFVARAAAYATLARKQNQQKKIAVQYLAPPEKDEILVGTPDTVYAESIIRLLNRMKQEGYVINAIPKDQDELIRWITDHGMQILSDAPADLDKLARSGKAALVPVATYRRWFESSVPAAQRAAVVKEWGEIPGKFMVWKDARGQQFIVIPKIDLGNIVLVPAQAPELEDLLDQKNRAVLLQRLRQNPYDVVPSHNQLAANFWIEHEFKADAMVVWEFLLMDYLLPRKMVGLSEADWPDILMGNLPNFRPWPISELNWSLPARRRTTSVLVDHLVSPDTTAGLADELLNLQEDILKWDSLPEGSLEAKFRESITRQVRALHLDRDLHLELKEGQVLTADDTRKVAGYLNEIRQEKVNVNTHVLGQPPRNDLLIPYLVSCLRGRFLDALGEAIPVPPDKDRLPGSRRNYLRQKAEEVIALILNKNLSPEEAVTASGGKIGENALSDKLREGFATARLLYDGFAKTQQEIDNMLVALNGRFVPPGPGNLPERNPAVVPTGRNMYVLNPEEIPSRASWELGRQLVDQLLAGKKKDQGRYPEKIGLSLDFRSTLMDYGVLESQILYLIGVRPVWDAANRVLDVEVIPAKELGRPRIDVFVETYDYYADYLEPRLRLWDKAIRLVADLDEPDNYVFKNRVQASRNLQADGVSSDRAETLARARIFAMPPELVTATHFLLLEETGQWDSRRELVDVYLAERDYVYTDGCWGQQAVEAYKRHLQGTEVVLRNITRGGPLGGAWYNGGNLCLMIKELTGKQPDYFISDLRNPGEEQVARAEDVLQRDYRATLFNRKWIEGMMKEGYAGAQQMAGGVFSTLGWEINRENSISSNVWQEIVDVYLRDKKDLNIRQWFEAKNPYAFLSIAERLLEATRKDYWKPDPATLREIAVAYAESVIRHGHRETGESNEKLDAFLAHIMTAPGPDPQAASALRTLLVQYQQKSMAEKSTSADAETAASVVPQAAAEEVSGKKLEPVAAPNRRPRLLWFAAGGIFVLLLIYGFVRRKGAVR
jgi:cobaltochelatase CobN